jgi:hypothetical protein
LFDKVKGQKSLKITSSMVDEVVQESFNVDLLQDSNLAHFYHHVQELPWINSQIIQELLDEKLTTDYWYFKELYLLGAVRVKTMNCLSVKNELYRKVLEKLKARLSTKTTP